MSRCRALLSFLALAVGVTSQSTSTANGFFPAAVPLAVRSPYLNVWQSQVNGTHPPNSWPVFWTEANIFGWSGYIRIDGSSFVWLGDLSPTTNLTNLAITPTRTIFTLQAGPMQLNVTFLSPIEPSDLVRQSLPFSYVFVEAASTDGNQHSVQLYSDISAEWASGDNTNKVTWSTTQTNTAVFHQYQLQSPQFNTEIGNIAEDSTVYYSMASGPTTTWQTGQDIAVRGQFTSNGKLLNTQDTSFRAIANDFPVFGHAVDLGNITSTPSPVVWAVGLVRDPAIQYVDASGNAQNRSSYFWTQYDNIGDVINNFLSDFSNALQRAVALDQKILADATTVSANYADLVSLGTRQAMGGMDITVSRQSNGTLDASDVKIFMKDVGNSRRVNPTEVLYASFPMFLYLNATLGGLLLDPLLEYQNSGRYPNSFAAPDIGLSYPAAPGNNADSHILGIEHSGNMLIMAFAHARISGDGSLISTYYSLLKKWADYLVTNSLSPGGQETSDQLSTSNQTNLAIKGIIGIEAMSEISAALGQTEDARLYAVNASSFVSQWLTLASSSGHLDSVYGQSSSFGLMYNLYADRLLGTNLVNNGEYTAQTNFYNSETASLPTNNFGFSFDNSAAGVAKSHWTMLTAGTASDAATRDLLVSMVHKRASENTTAGAFPSAYDANTGASSGGRASPAQGAVFSLLALNLTNRTITVPPPSSTGKPSSDKSPSNAGAIAGGVVAGFVFLAAFVAGSLLFRRRRNRHIQKKEPIDMTASYDVQLQPQRPIDLNTYTTHQLAPIVTQPYPRSQRYSDAGSMPNPWGGSEVGSSSQNLVVRSESQYHQESSRSYPVSIAPPSTYPGSAAGDTTEQLRTEVETLRREMQNIRAQRTVMYVNEVDETPPPEYIPSEAASSSSPTDSTPPSIQPRPRKS